MHNMKSKTNKRVKVLHTSDAWLWQHNANTLLLICFCFHLNDGLVLFTLASEQKRNSTENKSQLRAEECNSTKKHVTWTIFLCRQNDLEPNGLQNLRKAPLPPSGKLQENKAQHYCRAWWMGHGARHRYKCGKLGLICKHPKTYSCRQAFYEKPTSMVSWCAWAIAMQTFCFFVCAM